MPDVALQLSVQAVYFLALCSAMAWAPSRRVVLAGMGAILVLMLGRLTVQYSVGSVVDQIREQVGSATSTGSIGPVAVMAAVDALARQRQVPLDLTVTDRADAAAVDAAVRDESADLGLVHDGTTWRLVSREPPDAGVAALVRETVQQRTLATNAAAAGTSVTALTAGSRVEDRLLGPAQDAGTRYAVSFAFLFSMASLLFGMAIAWSVVDEKQSRVVEILVSSVRQLLLGKVAGNAVLALLQMVLFVGIGLVGVSSTDHRTILPALASASGWFLVYFLAGFVALACLWAAAGSLATRSEDLQRGRPC